MRKAIIYVETIAGVGHMPVVAYLAKALIKQNIDVYVMASSHSQEQARFFDFDNVTWCSLPTFLKDPATGKAQYTSNGKPYAEDLEFQAERSAAIEYYLQKIKPDYFVTETWPLGKGHFDSEMLPVFKACESILDDCRIFCIGRDVMNYPNHRGAGIDSDRVGIDILNRFYDGLIITGDERLFTVDESLKHSSEIAVPVHYAGYFSSPSPKTDLLIRDEDREVLVTTGGGYVPGSYDKIIRDVILARELSDMADKKWRIVISDSYPKDLQQEFKKLAKERASDNGIIIENLRHDFRELMSNAAALITTAGLNAAMEAMQVKLKRPMPVIFTPIGTMPPNATGQVPRTQKLVDLNIAQAYFPDQWGRPDSLAAIFNSEAGKTDYGFGACLKIKGAETAADIIIGKDLNIDETAQAGEEFLSMNFPELYSRTEPGQNYEIG